MGGGGESCGSDGWSLTTNHVIIIILYIKTLRMKGLFGSVRRCRVDRLHSMWSFDTRATEAMLLFLHHLSLLNRWSSSTGHVNTPCLLILTTCVEPRALTSSLDSSCSSRLTSLRCVSGAYRAWILIILPHPQSQAPPPSVAVSQESAANSDTPEQTTHTWHKPHWAILTESLYGLAILGTRG